MLLKVKLAIVSSGRRSLDIAKALNYSPSKISSIINESYAPSSMEWENLAAELNVRVHELVNAPNPQPTVTA